MHDGAVLKEIKKKVKFRVDSYVKKEDETQLRGCKTKTDFTTGVH